jgi:hypothetical protein
MAMPIRLSIVAAVMLSVLVARNAAAEVEVQTGMVIGERFGSGPVNFTADPFHKFDPMGGLRRLDRVTISALADWECVVQLANPEPVVQEVRYNALPSFAELWTNTEVDLQIDLVEQPNGVLIADPFQTVQNAHAAPRGAFFFRVVEPDEPFILQSLVGPGPIEFELFRFAIPFDTRRFVNGMQIGVPNGFSVFRERWDVSLTYTYEFTIIPTPGTAAPLFAGLLITTRSRRRP